MRTTVDIPDPIYSELKSRAALEGKTVKELLLRSVSVTLKTEPATPKKRRLKLPIIHSKRSGTLKIDNERIYDLIGFP
jgi:hypothetical protein